MKLGTQYRLFPRGISRKIDKDNRTVELSFSSEEPVNRIWGKEILVHGDGMRLDRLNSRANALFNHHIDDVVGVIEGARNGADRKGHALVRFGKHDRGNEVFGMVEDDILSNVSMAYRIIDGEEDKKTNTFRITEWEPMEISIVTVPADITVGVGRNFADSETEVHFRTINEPAAAAETQETNMSTEASATAGEVAEQHESQSWVQDNEVAAKSGNEGRDTRPTERRTQAMDMEKDRREGIENLCKANNIDQRIKNEWITSGASMRQVSQELMGILESRGKDGSKVISKIGLTSAETRRFSIAKAILAVSDGGNWTNAGFEAECSRAIAQKLGRNPDPQKFYVPYEVQERAARSPVEDLAYAILKRDLTVATAGAGGFLVETANVGFIELLRNRSVLFNMGARRLPGLQGNVAIPKQSATGSATWLATEATGITEITQTFVQIAMSPKNVGGYTEISRQLLLQANPAVEGLVMSDLATVVALAIDLAGLNGSGASGQPLGIIGTSGVGAVTGTSLAYDDIVEFQTDVFAGNALTEASGYVTTGAVAGLLKTRVKFASTASPIWEGRLESANVDGYRGMASNQMPAATMIFGDFGQVIVGEWGVLEVEVNPFANFQAGIVGVRAIASIDIAVRYPTAFSVAASIT